LENPHPDFLRPWNAVTIDMFISQKEASIKDFFLNKIDDLLNAYEPGDPKMKPDVIKQTKEIEEERAKMAEEQMKQMHNNTMTSIVMSKDGQPPRQLSQQDVLDIINGQRESIQQLLTQNEELKKITIQLQQQMMQMQSGMQLPPPQSSNDEKYKQEINTLKNKIELLEKQVKDKNSIETPKQDVIEIDMSRPKSEPEV